MDETRAEKIENLEEIERLEEAVKLDNAIERWTRSNIEKMYWDLSLDDYIPQNQKQEQALFHTKILIQNKVGKVIFTGSNGVGKTMLACCAVKALGGYIYTMKEIALRLRKAFSDGHGAEMAELDRLARAKFLVIDELGRTKGSDQELEWLSYIIDKRHVRYLPFMILSNKSLALQDGVIAPNSFQSYVGADVMSRLSDATFVNITGEDWRKK